MNSKYFMTKDKQKKENNDRVISIKTNLKGTAAGRLTLYFWRM